MDKSNATEHLKRQPNSSSCYACGLENPFGLQLVFYDDGGDQVVCEYSIPDRFSGYPGIAHGGVVAAMMDEVMIRTAMIDDPNRFMMTAKMEIRYRQPVPTSTPLILIGQRVKDRGRLLQARGELKLPDGSVAVEASVTAADLPPAHRVNEETLTALGWRVY